MNYFFLFLFTNYNSVSVPQIIAQLDSLDHEIRSHVSSCTADARQIKDEAENKEQQLSTVEKDACEYLKVHVFDFLICSV